MKRQKRNQGTRVIPMPIRVVEDGHGIPLSLQLMGQWTEVEAVESSYYEGQIDDQGELTPVGGIAESHYQLVTVDRSRVSVFKNHFTGQWYNIHRAGR